MKPVQVGILVAVAALGGGLFTKWLTSRNAAPVVAAPATAPAPATPAAPPAPALAQTQEQALPSPFPAEKPRRERAARHVLHKPQPVEPTVVAQNVAPAVNTAPVTEPAPKSEAMVPEPAPAAQPVPEPPEPPAPPAPPPPRHVTLTAGTLIPARTVEGLSSDRNEVDDTFTATLDQPLAVDGLVIAERGAHLEGKIVQSRRAGRVKGLADLAVELTQLTTSDGQRVAIETESFEQHGKSSVGEDAAKVGGGAAIGAAIGGIAGGGKGAGIGAAVGAAAGTGGVMATRGKAAVIAPETHISFRLRTTVTITERQNASR